MEELIRNIISDNSVETSLKEYGQGIFIDVNTVDIMIEGLKNLTVTHSCEKLKEKEEIRFEFWKELNIIDSDDFGNFLIRNGEWLNEKQLSQKYTTEV